MVEVARQTGQGREGVGFVTNQIFRCCIKIEGEHTFLMAATGEGQYR